MLDIYLYLVSATTVLSKIPNVYCTVWEREQVQKRFHSHERVHLKESLLLELCNPCLSTVIRKIVLVVLVAHKSNELSVNLGLGFGVLVSISGSKSEHGASLGGEKVVKLTCSIAVVISVSLLLMRYIW